MGRFTKIPQSTFDELQIETGVLLTNFDPETGDFGDEDILTATQDGITVNVKPTIVDYGEDIDNVPSNCKELAMVDDVDVNITTKAVNINKYNIKYYLTAADEDASGKITVRKGMLKSADFHDIWFVGDLSNGGFVAVCIKNGLSTDGLSLATGKKKKGSSALTIKGHFSIEDPDEVPVEFYIGEAAEGSVSLDKANLTLTEGDVAVIGVSCYPKSLADELEVTGTGTGTATAELTTDKKNIIVEATAEGTVTLTATSGEYSASCEITIEAESEG